MRGRHAFAVEAGQKPPRRTLPVVFANRRGIELFLLTKAILTDPSFNRARVKTLRTGLTIGAPQDFMTAVEGLGAVELCNIYGATETYGNCCVTWHHWPVAQRALCQGTPLPGNDLLYMTNTASDVFLEVQTQRYFVLLSGRWYAGPALNGPWAFVAADHLPPAFAQIPGEAVQGAVIHRRSGCSIPAVASDRAR